MTHEGLGPGDLPGCATGQQVQRLWLHHGRSSGDNIAVARGDAQRTERSVRVWRLRTPFGHRGGGGAREAYLRRGPQFVMRNPKHQRPNHAITQSHAITDGTHDKTQRTDRLGLTRGTRPTRRECERVGEATVHPLRHVHHDRAGFGVVIAQVSMTTDRSIWSRDAYGRCMGCISSGMHGGGA